MFLVIFILFGLQHQIQCNSAFKYLQKNRTFLNPAINDLRVQNGDYVGEPSGPKSNAKSQGLSLLRKMASARSAADVFRKNVDFHHVSREGEAPAPHSLGNPPPAPADPPAPLKPVFTIRPKFGKHKPRERTHQAEPDDPPGPLAPTPPPIENHIGRLLHTNQHLELVADLKKRKELLKAELASPQLRVDTGLPPAVLAYGTSREKALEGALDVPDPNLLDMAHAVGGRIPSMRYRNRLCSRHVLIPEGPKYDSRGAVYLPAFSPKGTGPTPRDYAVTRAPHLLLPKCCNCCKKSVLGCD